MGALLALIPSKDWLYGAAIAGSGLIGLHFYDKYRDAITYQNTVKAESAAAIAAAAKQIAENNAAHIAALAQLEKAHAAEIQANTAAHNADIARLRQLATAGKGKPVLGSPPTTRTDSGTRAGSSLDVGAVSVRSDVCLDLADALRADDATIKAERAERDSLTGK